jgi:GNAT superfamily N-acetyltransferase
MKEEKRTSFEQRIYQNWADHAGCARQDLFRPGTILLPEARFSGSKVIAIWSIGRHSLVQLDPEFLEKVQIVQEAMPEDSALTGDDLQATWGAECILERDQGLVHYLYPQDLPKFAVEAQFNVRQLHPEDAQCMAELHQACPPADVDEGFVEVDHLVAYGCFAGSQLAAAASGYIRTGFLDLGVLVHPDFRRLGLGKAVVGAVCRWSIDQGLIAQYRCNPLNTASQRLALGLNFKQYFQSASIWLK